MLRLGAITIALLPVVLGVLLSRWAWGAWIGPGVAIAGGVAIALVRPRGYALALLGTVLAILAGLMVPQLSLDLEGEQVLDLRSEPVPPKLDGRVAVTGFYRDEWTMAEYAVLEGELPQQDGPAEAILVPLLGVEKGPSPLRDALIVARVRPGDERAKGLRTVHGIARSLDDELLAVFVQASGLEVPGTLRGVLVDAVVEHRTSAWLRGVLVVLATIGAMVCWWIAWGKRAG